MSQPRLSVAICGAGIGGLITALALAKYDDVDVTVYESASRLAEVGAGIAFWPRPREILQRLGLEKELLRISGADGDPNEETSYVLRKSDQVDGYEFYKIRTGGQLRMHRADFQTVLTGQLKKAVVLSKRLVSYEDASSSAAISGDRENGPESPTVLLHFADGTTATCDVLIGADGLKSCVRSVMVERLAKEVEAEAKATPTDTSVTPKARADDIRARGQLTWSGFVAYRVIIPADQLRTRSPGHSLLSSPMMYCGKNAIAFGNTIKNGTALNVIFFTADFSQEHGEHPGEWVRKADKSEFAGMFKGWEPEVEAMLDCVGDSALRWAVHTTHSAGLLTYAHGRVALLGDAAHAMTSFQGSGAGQATEDAWILAHVLGDPRTTRGTISTALQAYNTVRRPFSLNVQENSRVNGHLVALDYNALGGNILDEEGLGIRGGDYDALDDTTVRRVLPKLGAQIQSDWEWAWTTSIDNQVEEALKLLGQDE